jgi:hypothetical protein
VTAPAGTYRLVVTATRYRLESSPFEVAPIGTLTVEEVRAPAGSVAVRLRYPPADPKTDLTSRPAAAVGGTVRFDVGAKTVAVRHKRGKTFVLRRPEGATVSVAAGGAQDAAGNTSGRAVQLDGP